jgi:hypothetical protein
MDDAGAMRGSQRVSDLDRIFQNIAESHGLHLILSGIKKGCWSPFSGNHDQPKP